MTPYVIRVGLATLDTIAAVPRHPGPEDRVVASERALGGGGPAPTAAVALARLGVPAFFVGWVGEDDAGCAAAAAQRGEIRLSVDGGNPVRDVPLRDALAFANACAALSCRALDGRSAIPTVEELAA
jgi:sulfofructose kinase